MDKASFEMLTEGCCRTRVRQSPKAEVPSVTESWWH